MGLSIFITLMVEINEPIPGNFTYHYIPTWIKVPPGIISTAFMNLAGLSFIVFYYEGFLYFLFEKNGKMKKKTAFFFLFFFY